VAEVFWEVEASGAFFGPESRVGGPGKEPPLFLIQISTESREHLFVSLGEIAELGKCSFKRHEVGF
jgi:hypothetical protein